MICKSCNKKIPYGAEYCIYCGEKIPQDVLDDAYNKTFWGKIQWVLDKLETISLKKITDNVIFKTVMMLLAVALMFLGISGDARNMHLAENDVYDISYNAGTGEYYILSEEDVIGLGIYVPKNIDEIRFSGYSYENELVHTETTTPEECQIIVEKGKFSYMTIEAIRKDKVTETIRFLY